MLYGIDVSSWQKDLNIQTLKEKNPGLSFVIIKLTQGSAYVNPQAKKHFEQAKAAGLYIGFYHYMSFGATMNEQADHFYAELAKLLGGDIFSGKYSYWLDWEAQSNAQNFTPGNSAPRDFCNRFETLTGQELGLYTTPSYADSVYWSGPLWLARWGENPQVTKLGRDTYTVRRPANCLVHQFTSRGYLPGYDGFLDLNAWNWPEETAELSAIALAAFVYDTIAGKYGNGRDREDKLRAEGADPEKVQEVVNFIYEKVSK